MATVKRKIQFFVFEPDDDTASFTRKGLAKSLSTLSFDTGTVYLDEDDEKLCVWDKSRSPDILRLIFGKLKKRDFPEQEYKGALELLNLGIGRTLAFKTHICVFEGNIIGAEFNNAGPRATKLAWYLRKQCPELPPGKLLPLADPDALKALERLGDVRLFDFAIDQQNIGLLQNKTPNLYQGMLYLGKGHSQPRIEVRLTAAKRDKKGILALGHSLAQEAQKLVKDKKILAAAERFVVKGLDTEQHKVISLNLLDKVIVAEDSVLLIDEEHGTVDSDEMFDKIIAAYQRLKPVIQRSLGLG